jgi:SpoVK/Ycf46/Vps4 family AAA+-type ATPase
VGESAKNIDAVFEEAKAVDAVLVFDEGTTFITPVLYIYVQTQVPS